MAPPIYQRLSRLQQAKPNTKKPQALNEAITAPGREEDTLQPQSVDG